MKVLVLSLSILLLATSCNTKKIVLTEDQLPDDIFYLENQIRPFSGECVVLFQDGQGVKELLTFKDGILDGIRESYYPNGQLSRKGQYLNGKLHGKWTAWDEKGNLKYEVHYESDKLTGHYITWFHTGVIKEKGMFDQDRKIGEWIYSDEAGMRINKI